MATAALEKQVIKVSHSEADSHALCKRRHWYQYGMAKEPKGNALSEVLYRGNVLDAGLNAYFLAYQKGATPTEALTVLLSTIVANADQDGKKDMVIIANLVARSEWFHNVWSPKFARWQVISVQGDYPYTLRDSENVEVQMVALPDLVARIPGEGICVVDFKSVRDFYPEVMYQMGTQLPKYAAAVSLQMPVAKVGFMEIRHRSMKSENPVDYFKLRLEKVGRARTLQTLHEHEVIAEEVSLLRAFKDAGQLDQWEQGAYRTINKHVCNYCPFFDLCTAEMRGDDTELMLQSLYQPRRRRKELVVNDD